MLYINGGHPPWSALDYVLHCCQLALLLNPWRLTKVKKRLFVYFQLFVYFLFTLQTALRKVAIAWLHLLPRVRQVAQSSAAVFS